MAFARKGSRPITVDGYSFRWRSSWDDSWGTGGIADVNVQLAEGGSKLIANGVATGLPNLVLLPSHIQAIIRHALASGWDPSPQGADYRLADYRPLLGLPPLPQYPPPAPSPPPAPKSEFNPEAEWLASTSPRQLLLLLNGKGSERKYRLFALACCQRLGHRLSDERSRVALEVAELLAEGSVTKAQRKNSRREAYQALEEQRQRAEADPNSLHRAAVWAATAAAAAVGPSAEVAASDVSQAMLSFEQQLQGQFGEAEGRAAQCRSLRCLFANPFRPGVSPAAWLAWNGGRLAAMAQAISEQRRFEELPILADALEEAGCTDSYLLGHCRQDKDHARGCWVLDLLLGKE